MKRAICVTVALVIIGGVMLTVLVRPAAAQRPYDDRTIRGTYVGGLVEIRDEGGGVIQYCDTAGRVTFDGAGSGTSHLTRRCSVDGTIVDDLTLTYAVSPDGFVDVLFSSGEDGRFQLALGGQVVFITANFGFDASVLVHQGHFIRQ